MRKRGSDPFGFDDANPSSRQILGGGRCVVAAVFSFLLISLLSGCKESNKPTVPSSSAALSVTNRQDRIELVLTVSPGEVELTRDHILDISATFPSEMDVTLPDMATRLDGFITQQIMDEPASQSAGSTHLRRRYLLTPRLAREYRIAPAALTYVDKSHTPPRKGWFPSPAMTLTAPALASAGSASPTWDLSPRWIRPSSRELALWSVYALLILVALWLLWKVSKRLRRQIRLMVMSPRDRAIFELQELLASDLLARGDYKEFYLRLTRIVRQFIERRHGIRAPEQTTEEFLAAISKDSRFPTPVASRLRAFLHASDLVKFAAHTPDQTAIDDVTSTARNYIESDVPEPANKKGAKHT